MKKLIVFSPCFEDGGLIPVKYTGHGEDVSPELVLDDLSEMAESVAIIMDDMGHPIPSKLILWALYKDVDMAGIDIGGLSRHLIGHISITLMYFRWIVVLTCQALPEKKICWRLCRVIFCSKQYWPGTIAESKRFH